MEITKDIDDQKTKTALIVSKYYIGNKGILVT